MNDSNEKGEVELEESTWNMISPSQIADNFWSSSLYMQASWIQNWKPQEYHRRFYEIQYRHASAYESDLLGILMTCQQSTASVLTGLQADCARFPFGVTRILWR